MPTSIGLNILGFLFERRSAVRQITFRLLTVLFIQLAVAATMAAPPPLGFDHTLRLSRFSGDTFLNAMTAKRGIKFHFDDDYEQQYEFAGWNQVEVALENFDRKIVNRVLGAFPDGKAGLKKFVDSIEEVAYSPSMINELVIENYNGRGNVYALAQFIGMAGGSGTLVIIDSENYYYNYGYKAGRHPDDVKSGRSYGAGPVHNANDASDVMYLDELEQYMQNTPNSIEFYEVFLRILTETNTAGYSSLSPLGQTVMTDLIAIYTAELDRHLMVKLNPAKHPWENDLAEATFLAGYTSVEGKVMKDGVLVDGRMRNYWAMSEVSERSGIGIGRADRRKLQRLISRYIRTHHSHISNKIDGLIGKRSDGDLFRGLTEFINNYQTQTEVLKNGPAISEAFTTLLTVIQNEATEITESVEDWQ
jgi:hypothetical protein